MNFTEHARLREAMGVRADIIADAWYTSIAKTSFTAVKPARVRQQLRLLVDNATTAMLSKPFDRRLAQSVGADLARLHYVAPESLSRTQEILSQQFVEGLAAAEASDVLPRLSMLLGELGAGFYNEMRSIILREQEEIRGALFDAYKRAQHALAISEQQFRSAFDDAAIGMALVTLEGRFQKVNRALCTILGYDEHELIGMSWQDPVHSGDHVADGERMQFLRQGDIPAYQVEQRYCHKRGHVSWIALSVSLVRGGDGQPAHFIAQFQDVTKRNEALAALRTSEERLRAVIANAPVVLFAMDAQGIITLLEGRALETLGVPPGSELGRPYTEVQYLTRQVRRNIERALGGEEFEVVNELAGEIFETRYAPIRDAHGELAGTIAVATNITERRRAEHEHAQRLEEQAAREAAEEALHMREVFLSVAAHELRTPLATLLGHATILERRAQRDRSVPPPVQQGLATISQQGRRLNDLVETLLDLSRLQQDRLDLEHRPIDLSTLVRQVVAEVQPTVEQHVLIVETPDQDVVITGDEQRLEQVLHNLLSNAIKYSPMGGTIRIAVTQTHDYGLMAVSDQGIGIPLSAQPNLFKQFFRASNVDPRQFSGLGIGLYLVHEIVTMHGGSIAVDSQEGEGSTFTVALPLRHQVIDHEVGGVST